MCVSLFSRSLKAVKTLKNVKFAINWALLTAQCRAVWPSASTLRTNGLTPATLQFMT